MPTSRLTREDIRNATGNFNPVGHAVLVFADDDTAAQAEQALRDSGFDEPDILKYSGATVAPRLRQMVETAGEGAGFGYEITLLRRYLSLAEEGASSLIVYAPDDEHTDRAAEVAKRFNAKSAVKYNRLINEELV